MSEQSFYPDATEESLAAPRTLPAEIAAEASAAGQTRALVFLMLLGVALLYVVGIEQGSLLQGLINSEMVHEFLHDARHASGFACH